MARRGRPPGDRERRALDDAMRGVEPLAGRDKLAPPPEPRPPPAPARRRRENLHFEVMRVGERVEGRAAGIDPRHLRRLRSGEVEVEARIDLHGLDAEAARRSLRGGLDRAYAGGERCVLVIHGRGLHSPGDAVLKQALPDWLVEPPLDRRVMAFSTARERDGGAGASYVLLRRAR